MENYKKYSDNQLAFAIKQSDESAFKVLYYRYYQLLYRFIWMRIRSEELTKDLLQEIFTRLWQNRQHLDTRKSIKAYIYRISHNLLIDHYRKKGFRKTYNLENQVADRLSADEDIEMQIRIRLAVENLPKKLHSVFILSRYEGLKYFEIAEALGISIKTVESRISKALFLLRDALL
jgi:RNA polymerase sigma-70 factor (ECF subfamily)